MVDLFSGRVKIAREDKAVKNKWQEKEMDYLRSWKIRVKSGRTIVLLLPNTFLRVLNEVTSVAWVKMGVLAFRTTLAVASLKVVETTT